MICMRNGTQGWPCTFLVPFLAEPFIAQLGCFDAFQLQSRTGRFSRNDLLRPNAGADPENPYDPRPVSCGYAAAAKQFAAGHRLGCLFHLAFCQRRSYEGEAEHPV